MVAWGLKCKKFGEMFTKIDISTYLQKTVK